MRVFPRLLIAGLAAFAAPASAQGNLWGTVYDSLHRAPLARAGVIATPLDIRRDTSFHSVLSDAHGRFSFVGLQPGRYTLTVEHAMLDSTGIGINDVMVDVSTVGPTTIDLSTPSTVSLRRALCPATGNDTTVGVMLGVVRHTDGTPVPQAAVVFSWNDFEVDNVTASVITHRVTSSTTGDANGVYRRCGVPLQRPIFVQAQGAGREESGIVQEVVSMAGFLVRDFRIAGEPVPAGGPLESAGHTVVGTITDVRDRGLPRAQVTIAGSGRVVLTNSDGEFRIVGAPAGSRSIEVTAIGYYPRSTNVEVDRLAAPVRIRMERTAVILDSLQVIAKRTTRVRNLNHEEFEARRFRSAGTFFSKAAIDSLHAVEIFDVLRHTPAVALAQERGGFDMQVVSNRGATGITGAVCPLDVFLDGMRIKQEDLRGIPPEIIYGIEIHGVATAPPRFKVGLCGGLFVWTR